MKFKWYFNKQEGPHKFYLKASSSVTNLVYETAVIFKMVSNICRAKQMYCIWGSRLRLGFVLLLMPGLRGFAGKVHVRRGWLSRADGEFVCFVLVIPLVFLPFFAPPRLRSWFVFSRDWKGSVFLHPPPSPSLTCGISQRCIALSECVTSASCVQPSIDLDPCSSET